MRWQQRLNSWDAARFDRDLGVDTGGIFRPTELTVHTGDAHLGVIYFGAQTRLFRWLLTGLPSDPAGYTFVDMGSGKGRVLLLAAQVGYGRVIGVEFAEELHAVALNNARIVRERGLSIEPLLGDAAAFEFPDAPLVVHFNNPFHDPVMKCVIASLTQSYERRPRPIVVVYHQMTVEQQEDVTGNLGLLDAIPFLAGRTLGPPAGAIDRSVLAPFTVRVYESAEVGKSVPSVAEPTPAVGCPAPETSQVSCLPTDFGV